MQFIGTNADPNELQSCQIGTHHSGVEAESVRRRRSLQDAGVEDYGRNVPLVNPGKELLIDLGGYGFS